METESAIRGRRTIRAYLPDPVPEKTLRSILDQACWSPSMVNSQEWNVYVVTGESLARVKQGFAGKAAAGEAPEPDLEMSAFDGWPAHIRERMNVIRPGEPGRPTSGPFSIWDVYGAPCLLISAVDANRTPVYQAFDSGLFVESVCLAAYDAGLSTAIMGLAVLYPRVLREVLPDTEDKRFLIGVAIGYADAGHPANQIERRRVPLDEIVTWAS